MEVKTVIIPDEAEGMKTGLFLRRFLPDLPESTFRKVFSSRDVKLDGIRVTRDTPVRAGQTLSVFLPSLSVNTESLRIVYEDRDVLLVNKPAGISVEADEPGSLSLTDLCRLYLASASGSDRQCPAPDVSAGNLQFPAPCHRLDNKTSGLCLFAKNEPALSALLEAFKVRSVDKYYTCLVRGMMKPSSAVCSAWLLKDAERAVVRILDHDAPGARPIVTGYETLEAGPVSRLRVHLITGRTHQIRAHLSALGHPILGDDLYGDHAFNRLYKSRSLKLCATELVLHTNGQLPALENRSFSINPPF